MNENVLYIENSYFSYSHFPRLLTACRRCVYGIIIVLYSKTLALHGVDQQRDKVSFDNNTLRLRDAQTHEMTSERRASCNKKSVRVAGHSQIQ